MPLYLATFKLETTQYMGSTKVSDAMMRLIRAEHIDAAEDKLNAVYDRNDPYGCSVTIVDLDITSTIE